MMHFWPPPSTWELKSFEPFAASITTEVLESRNRNPSPMDDFNFAGKTPRNFCRLSTANAHADSRPAFVLLCPLSYFTHVIDLSSFPWEYLISRHGKARPPRRLNTFAWVRHWSSCSLHHAGFFPTHASWKVVLCYANFPKSFAILLTILSPVKNTVLRAFANSIHGQFALQPCKQIICSWKLLQMFYIWKDIFVDLRLSNSL